MSRKRFLATTAGAAIGLGARGTFKGKDRIVAAPATSPGVRRVLGDTGIEVSTVGLGAGRIPDRAVIEAAFDRGVNLIDTARRYQNGRNEQLVGNVVKGRRDDIVIMTKISRTDIPDRERMERSIVESLRALGTDHIDILLIHGASSLEETRSESLMDVFSRARERGDIRFFGFSSHANQLALLRREIEDRFHDVVLLPYTHTGWFDHSQYGFHSEWDQDGLENLMEKAVARGIGLVAMKTCSAGRYRMPGSDAPSYRDAIRWVLRNPAVSSTTIAMASFEEFSENIGAME